MPRHTLLADPFAALAAGLLFLVLAGRVALVAWAPEPVRAHEALGGDRSSEGRRVLVVDATGTPHALQAARLAGPGPPLEVRAAAGNSRLRALVRAYGFTRLPVLLTIDTQGRVVRAEPGQ